MPGNWPTWRQFLGGGGYAGSKHPRPMPCGSAFPMDCCMLPGFYANALLPYSQALSKLAPHIQQVSMESNGKRVTMDGTVTVVGAPNRPFPIAIFFNFFSFTAAFKRCSTFVFISFGTQMAQIFFRAPANLEDFGTCLWVACVAFYGPAQSFQPLNLAFPPRGSLSNALIHTQRIGVQAKK